MTGGGFGGAIVTVLDASRVDELAAAGRDFQRVF